jgi:hypothetical protein
MRQGTTHSNAFKGGRSFSYRDIFSGLSNEKMGPVPCVSVCSSYWCILPAFTKYLLFIPAFFYVWQSHLFPSPQGRKPSYGKVFLRFPKSLCLLKGASLVLLKTNFAKKPKNPV